MDSFPNVEAYEEALMKRDLLPEGFLLASTQFSFIPKEIPVVQPYPMSLAAIVAKEPCTSFAGVFTKNAIPGAPVILGKERLKQKTVQGILINNKIANVANPSALTLAKKLSKQFSDLMGFQDDSIFSVSTGIIGWELPEREILNALPDLQKSMGSHSGLDVARSIMTTDSYPKLRSVELAEGARIWGICKGAGMIEPNMATMLSFILTDVQIEKNELQELLQWAVSKTFNSISVDSDQSTSDMVLALSSSKKQLNDKEAFKSALLELCLKLSRDIVKNGEGTAHLIRCAVKHRKIEAAKIIAKAVINSPLVKTAIYGNDPNVGRILMAIGDVCGNSGIELDPQGFTISIGDELVYHNGSFSLDWDKEKRLSDYLQAAAFNTRLRGFPQHDRDVFIHVDMGGDESAEVLGSDLSHDYVRENADYRS